MIGKTLRRAAQIISKSGPLHPRMPICQRFLQIRRFAFRGLHLAGKTFSLPHSFLFGLTTADG